MYINAIDRNHKIECSLLSVVSDKHIIPFDLYQVMRYMFPLLEGGLIACTSSFISKHNYLPLSGGRCCLCTAGVLLYVQIRLRRLHWLIYRIASLKKKLPFLG